MGVAGAIGGFSIREYTASIRSRDVKKCWPFDGEVREGLLPQIEYPKYRWWFAELQTARSAKEDDNQEVGRAENKDSNGLQGKEYVKRRTSRMPKAKTLKRKCVAELVAAAPQVGIVEECEKGSEESAGIAGTNPRVPQEATDGLNQSKKRKRVRTREVRANKIKRDSDVILKKDEKKGRAAQKRRKRVIPGTHEKEEETRIVQLLPSTDHSLVKLGLGCAAKGIRGKRKAKGSEGLKTEKEKKDIKEQKKKTLENRKESKVSSPHHHNVETDASVNLVGVQITDTTLTSEVLVRIEERRTDQRGNCMTGLRSPPLQNLCRVFSDVLAAAKSLKDTNKENNKGSVTFQGSVDDDALTDSNINHRSQRTDTFGEMIDLNQPIESWSNHVDAAKEAAAVGQRETDLLPLEDGANNGVSQGSSLEIFTTATRPPIPRPASLLSALQERRKGFTLTEDSIVGRSEEVTVTAINDSCLTREVSQRQRATFLENGSSRDMTRGLPITRKGEILPQDRRRNQSHASDPPDIIAPGHDFFGISSANQASWKPPGQPFLGCPQESTRSLSSDGNLINSFSINSANFRSPRKDCRGQSSSVFLSAPSIVRLMGIDLPVSRSSNDQTRTGNEREWFSRSTPGSVPNQEVRGTLEPNVNRRQNKISKSMTHYRGDQFGSKAAMAGQHNNFFSRDYCQPASLSGDQFIPFNRLTHNHLSNSEACQRLLVGNHTRPSSQISHTRNQLPFSSASLRHDELMRWPAKEVRVRRPETSTSVQHASQGTHSPGFNSTNRVRQVIPTSNAYRETPKRSRLAEDQAAFEAFRLDEPGKETSSSGPVKLSAGARHVLKRGRTALDRDKTKGKKTSLPVTPESPLA